MITIDPDTAQRDRRQRRVAQERETASGCTGGVARTGLLRVGDPVLACPRARAWPRRARAWVQKTIVPATARNEDGATSPMETRAVRPLRVEQVDVGVGTGSPGADQRRADDRAGQRAPHGLGDAEHARTFRKRTDEAVDPAARIEPA